MRFKALLIILLLSSCTVQKRCERKLRKAEKLGCLTYSNDTIVFHDTIKGFRVDTLVQFDTLNFQDTLIVEKDGVKSTTIIRWRERVVTQSLEKQDTIIRNVHHFKTKTVKIKPKYMKYVNIVFILLVILGVIYTIKKIFG